MLLSTVLLVISVTLFLLGYVVPTSQGFVSLQDDFHVGVWGHGLNSEIIFFNDAEYGPYHGSIIALVDADGNTYPNFIRNERFGPIAGIYYRYFETVEWKLWTLMVNLWHPILFFSFVAAATFALKVLRPIQKSRSTDTFR